MFRFLRDPGAPARDAADASMSREGRYSSRRMGGGGDGDLLQRAGRVLSPLAPGLHATHLPLSSPMHAGRRALDRTFAEHGEAGAPAFNTNTNDDDDDDDDDDVDSGDVADVDDAAFQDGDRGEGSSGTHMQGDDGMDLDISTEDMSE